VPKSFPEIMGCEAESLPITGNGTFVQYPVKSYFVIFIFKHSKKFKKSVGIFSFLN
jgi:hypothetical protein